MVLVTALVLTGTLTVVAFWGMAKLLGRVTSDGTPETSVTV